MITVAGHDYVTAQEAAELMAAVGLTRDRLYDWTRRGLITPTRVGQRRYYPLSDLWTVERDTRRRPGGGRRRGPSAIVITARCQ